MKSNQTKLSPPSQLLVDYVNLLPRGRVLDVAMGKGRNAIYLAGRGFEVEGVDISGDSIELACRFANESGVSLKAMVGDLEGGYVIPESRYDVIICFNYLQRSLIGRIKGGLKSGGMVVYETYTIDQSKYGKPKNPDYLLKYNELLDMFRDFHCLYYREGIFEGPRAIAGIVAQKK